MGKESRSGRVRSLVLSILAVLACGGVALGLAWPRLFPGPLVLAEDAYRRGDWRRAERLAAARLKSSPDDRRAMRLQARAAARLGHDDAARGLYDRLGGLSAMQAEDFLLFGKIIHRLGDRETAGDCFSAGLDADPNHPGLLEEIALEGLRSGRPIQAAHFARRLEALPGWEDRGGILLGRALDLDDDPAGAAECWSRALGRDREIASRDVGFRGALARAWLRLGRPSEARGVLLGGENRPDEPEFSWLLSRADLQGNAPAEATAHLEAGRPYRDAHPLEPEPAPYVGSGRCRQCHREIADSFERSPHARTFHRGLQTDLGSLPAGSLADPGDPTVRHSIRRSDRELRFETRHGDRVLSAVVAYAFGSGKLGMTPVGRDEQGRFRELRLSTYKGHTIWDVTSGQATPPKAGADHLGRILSSDDLRDCFFCHATVARSARDQTGPESADPAIGCERCHGPGGHHLRAISLGFPDVAIANPGVGRGAPLVALCGGCHGPMGRDVPPTDPLAPRFPAPSLTRSRCYTESAAAIDCLTCHEPHRDVETSQVYYEQKCLECHSKSIGAVTSTGTPNATSMARPSQCPVNPARGCLECHMPRVDTPVPHTLFTDHHIRIRGHNDPRGGLAR